MKAVGEVDYLIQDIANPTKTRTVHLDTLKPYEGAHEVQPREVWEDFESDDDGMDDDFLPHLPYDTPDPEDAADDTEPLVPPTAPHTNIGAPQEQTSTPRDTLAAEATPQAPPRPRTPRQKNTAKRKEPSTRSPSRTRLKKTALHKPQSPDYKREEEDSPKRPKRVTKKPARYES